MGSASTPTSATWLSVGAASFSGTVLVALSEKKFGIGTVEMFSAGAHLDRRDGRGGQDDAGGPGWWL